MLFYDIVIDDQKSKPYFQAARQPEVDFNVAKRSKYGTFCGCGRFNICNISNMLRQLRWESKSVQCCNSFLAKLTILYKESQNIIQ